MNETRTWNMMNENNKVEVSSSTGHRSQFNAYSLLTTHIPMKFDLILAVEYPS